MAGKREDSANWFLSSPDAAPSKTLAFQIRSSLNLDRGVCGCFSSRAGTAMEEESVANGTTMVNVPSHPLIKHWISVLRNEQTPCATFKNAMAELGRLLIYEASRDWLVCQSMRRDEMTLEPSLYLNKLPDKFQEGSHILLIDPMLATGVLLFNAGAGAGAPISVWRRNRNLQSEWGCCPVLADDEVVNHMVAGKGY
ncbi:hypothetical protein GW17_00037090 [Ensete ventricosum]|nr:hypothetical protein GW17_00037090 [Ensete ventricosum]